MAQLSLPLWLANEQQETFASFRTGDNNLLLGVLQQLLTPQGSGYLYFWSTTVAGKSHLLHAACTELALRGEPVGYVPLTNRTCLLPEVLEGMEQLSLVCIDNIELIAGDTAWELALFNLFNRIRSQTGYRLLIGASHPPRQLSLQLPDLASRLDWGQIYKLQPLADNDKLRALQLRAHLRGFSLPDDVGQFLLKRLNRDMRALCDALDTLDRASIAAQRKVTVPFVKTILKIG